MIPFSIIGILAVVSLAWALGFRKTPVLGDAAAAMQLVDDAMPGFGATEAVLDADGHGALVANAGGRVALVRPMGDRWLVRAANGAATDIADGRLTVRLREPLAGRATLALGAAAPAWAERL